MAVKVGMVSLGCSKNQVDAEIMLAKLRKAGFQLCTDAGTIYRNSKMHFQPQRKSIHPYFCMLLLRKAPFF